MQWLQELEKNNIGNILENEPLARYTTWKIGGPADAVIQVKDKQGLINTIKILAKHQVPWKILGKGSNLLVSDNGFKGAIISLQNFNTILVKEQFIRVGVGYSLIHLANTAAKHGLSGLEFAGGIPGTVGGAIYMNAGAHGSDISHILQEAEMMNENGDLTIWNNEDFKFAYRTSVLQERKGIILSALFKLTFGDRKKITEEMAGYKKRRQETQPFHLPCSGSVFRNPQGDYAGRLIEQLGLKGYRIGGAEISTKHANFIVNTGDASANDVLALINFIKKQVLEKYNIELAAEVELVGER